MGDHHFYVRPCKVYGGIQRFFRHTFVYQVQKSVSGDELFVVQLHFQPLVQIGVMLHHFLNKFQVYGIIGKEFRIRGEAYQGPVLFSGFGFAVFHQDPFGELAVAAFSVTEGFNVEHGGSGINRFQSHAVQTYCLLKGFVVVFCPGVHFVRGVYHFSERNAPPVIPYRYDLIQDGYADNLPVSHGIFVNRVVNDFLDQDIEPVIGSASVT